MSYILNYFVLIAILLCKIVMSDNDEAKFPKVVLPHGGTLVGNTMNTESGKPFRAFRGIPYAEPPTGDLRFMPPVPAKLWSGVKHATEDGNECISQNPFTRVLKTEGDEDCLYLNVYTPEAKPDGNPLSVMVYIYGGGFMTGNGNSYMYGPHRLLEYNVILVSGNYRTGALGFLTTGTKECPGNNGLKDQNMILKWVQENIAAFGGNPKDVTLFGESAGAASVAHHIYSPLSKGLFHKAILESGTNFDPWALVDMNQALERTKKLGEILNCPTVDDNNWQGFLDCLRKKSATDIVAIVFDIEPSVLFAPTIEPSNEGAFMTKHPNEVEDPPSGDVPIIIGLTTDEGLFKSLALIHILKDDFVANFEKALPQILYYSHYPKDIQEKITQECDQYYFEGKHDWSLNTHQNLTNLITDAYFTWGTDKFLRHRFAGAKNNPLSGSTYVYQFDQRSYKSYAPLFIGATEYYGVCHGDELLYLFTNKQYEVQSDAENDTMNAGMPKMWTNFAKTGNPTPDTSDLPKWNACDKFPLNYARIGSKSDENWTLLSNEVGLWEDRVKFGRELGKNLLN